MAFTVDFEEEDTFPRSTVDEGVFVGIRQLICAWEDRDTLVREIDTAANNQWPEEYEGPAGALAHKAAIRPMGKQTNAAGTLASYEKARVTVEYTNLIRVLDGATFLSEWLDFYTQTRELDEGLFRWDNNAGTPLRPGEAPHYAMHGMIYVARFHRVMAVPGWVLGRIQTCNANTVGSLLLGLTFPPETLRYQPPKLRTSVTLGRISTFEITTSYLHHPVGWNTFLRESTGQWEAMYVAGGARYKPYTPIVY